MNKKDGVIKPEKTDKSAKLINKEDMEKVLIENFIALQKVLTNLSSKFDELSTNISKLLELFEISAKSFADKIQEGVSDKPTDVDRELIRKLEALLDQNKTIARGIMLMEEKIKDRGNPVMTPRPPIQQYQYQNQVEDQSQYRKPLPKY